MRADVGCSACSNYPSPKRMTPTTQLCRHLRHAKAFARPLTASDAIASEAGLAGAVVALRGVGAVSISSAASVVGAAEDHG
jgi:hypothetical protein